jgi:hypothetical protein
MTYSHCRTRLEFATIGLFLTAMILVGGCRPAGPDVQFAEGVVALDGQPLADAMVRFIPSDQMGISATGITDARGVFRLSATQGQRYGGGTVEGTYIVTVSKSEPMRTVEIPADGGPPPDVPMREVVPKVYTDTATSPLRATVAKGRNSFQFEVSSTSSTVGK